MATLTVSIPEELKKKLERHPEINWSAYLRERFIVKLRQLRKFEQLIDQGVI